MQQFLLFVQLVNILFCLLFTAIEKWDFAHPLQFIKQLNKEFGKMKSSDNVFKFVDIRPIKNRMWNREDSVNMVVKNLIKRYTTFASSGNNMANKRDHAINAIVGGPGSGKTALLAHLYQSVRDVRDLKHFEQLIDDQSQQFLNKVNMDPSTLRRYLSNSVGIFVDYSDKLGKYTGKQQNNQNKQQHKPKVEVEKEANIPTGDIDVEQKQEVCLLDLVHLFALLFIWFCM